MAKTTTKKTTTKKTSGKNFYVLMHWDGNDLEALSYLHSKQDDCYNDLDDFYYDSGVSDSVPFFINIKLSGEVMDKLKIFKEFPVMTAEADKNSIATMSDTVTSLRKEIEKLEMQIQKAKK